jgi:hypothetical protein
MEFLTSVEIVRLRHPGAGKMGRGRATRDFLNRYRNHLTNRIKRRVGSTYGLYEWENVDEIGTVTISSF